MCGSASDARAAARVIMAGVAGALGVSATLGSCLLADFERGDQGVGQGGAAGGAGGAGQGACQLVGFPSPTGTTAGGAEQSFVVAVRSISITDELVGLDLDGVCSCVDGAGPSCTPTPGAQTAMSYCDGPGGRDNALALAFEPIRIAHQIDDLGVFYSEAADRGDWSLLIEVQGWGGEADDDQVRVALYPTLQFATVGPTPSWDGSDLWPIVDSAVIGSGGGPPEPRYVDETGYVTGGVLVAHIDQAELRIDSSDGTFTLFLSQLGLLAHIVDSAQGPALEQGKLTAVMPAGDVFALWASFRRQDGGGICTDDPLYSLTHDLLCNAQDLRVGPGDETTPCNALSAGIDFDAYPARMGAPAPPPATVEPCAPGASPTDDVCLLP